MAKQVAIGLTTASHQHAQQRSRKNIAAERKGVASFVEVGNLISRPISRSNCVEAIAVALAQGPGAAGRA